MAAAGMQEQTHNKNVCIILPVAQAHNIVLTMSQINDFLHFSKKFALFGLHYSGIAEIFPGGGENGRGLGAGAPVGPGAKPC